jgi:hypothetical protein
VNPRRLSLLLAISLSSLLPSLARAQEGSLGNLGATRVPREVRGMQAAPAQADPMSQGTEPFVPQRVTGSKTLGSGKADPSDVRIQRTAESLAAPGGVMGMDSQPADVREAVITTPATGPLPELHVVQKGDSLWSLCSRYYNDPWRWPRLWAANPMITNPHWIFPGDVIRLGEGGTAAAAIPPAGPAETPRPGLMSVNRVAAEGGNAIMLRELGFIEAKDLDQAGTISGSREEKIMLSSGDQAYLRYPKKAPLRPGERYSVFQTDTDHAVVDAETGKTWW